MELMDYVHLVRKGWRIIAAAVLGCILLAGLYTVNTPNTYQATTQFFVSTSDSENTSQLAQGGTFTQQRVKSYTQLLTTPRVLAPVAESLNLGISAQALSGRVSASVPPDTVLITVAVTGPTPAEAQAIAQAIATQFPTTVSDLERVSDTAGSPVKVTVVQPAEAQRSPISPMPTRNLTLAAMLGLLLGIGLVVLRDVLDNKIRDKDDVEKLTTIPVIGSIPFDSSAAKAPLVVNQDAHSLRGEAFRSLRTNLQFVNAASHPRAVSVTSSMAGEGKSTTTANLALSLAQSGARVCLIEGDLRRPRLLDYLGMEGAVGLTDVLIGRAELADVLQPFGQGTLHVLGAGAIPPNPSELLASKAMRDTLAALSSTYNYVLIDAPPLLPVTDAAVLATMVDGSILIAGSGLVTADQMTQALASLEGVSGQVLGVVLNRVPKTAGGYYHYEYESRPSASQSRSARRERQSTNS